jgi:hypothetical protein
MTGRKGRWVRHGDINEDLVQDAVAGRETPPLGTEERVAAVRCLAAEGLKDAEIAGRLWWWRDCDPTTVGVFRLRHKIPAAFPRVGGRAA